jgi:hypothetical protein
MEKNRNAYRIWMGNLKERGQLEDQGMMERKTLKWVQKK